MCYLLCEYRKFKRRCNSFVENSKYCIVDSVAMFAAIADRPPTLCEWLQVEKDIDARMYLKSEDIESQYEESCNKAIQPKDVALYNEYMSELFNYLREEHNIDISNLSDLTDERSHYEVGQIAAKLLIRFINKKDLEYGILFNIFLHYVDFDIRRCAMVAASGDLLFIYALSAFDESKDIGLKVDLASALAIFVQYCFSDWCDNVWHCFTPM